ncbi:PA14 domain-containing protein [Nocardia sp. XZ_19_369]|uniref:PA14 domain-containing protein n=1 Tax=Nocardia sp. XZ_19_369 TaxID=2769487 RepID=UPI0018905D32|nr:PA14 domain-containing protein [Nocardia sp. XZ_19_369]
MTFSRYNQIRRQSRHARKFRVAAVLATITTLARASAAAAKRATQLRHVASSSFVHIAVFVVAMAVGVSLVQVVLPPPALAGPSKLRDVPVLSPVDNPKPLRGDPVAQPEADFGPLRGAGTTSSGTHDGFDPKTSKEASRTENSVEYVNKNGSRSVVLSRMPVSVRDERGGWVPMDTRVLDKPGSKIATAARDGAHTQFAPYADDPALVRVDTGNAPVSLGLDGARKAQREVSGSTVTYREVMPGQDLQYTVEPGAVKEAVIVKDAKAVGDGRWVFTLKLGNGLTPHVKDDGVVITDGKAVQVAALPPIEVFDSAVKNAKDKKKAAPARTGGKYTLVRKGDSWSLTVSVDKGWLTDKKRAFPITIDPTYTYGFGNTAETRAYSSGSAPQCDNTCGIQVGNARPDNANLFWRSAFRFDFSPLFGKAVIGARMDFRRTGQTGTSAPVTSKLYQASNPLGYTATGPQLASASLGDAGAMFSSALTGYIAERVAAKDNNAWFLLSGGETDDFSFKTLQSGLVVDYGTAPPPTTLVAPADESVTATATPTLAVSPVTNPSGDATLYCFKVATGFDGRSGSVVDSGCLSKPTWTVPLNVLHDGGKYTWTVLTALAGGVTTTTPQWVGHFTVNQRVGDTGKSTIDAVGPMSVNLFNGNVHTDTGGPQFVSVGGKSGIALAYNSRQGEPHGVRASYFNDSTHTGKPDAVPVMVRTEPQVNMDWGNALSDSSDNLPWKPNPIPSGLNPDWYVVRWEGQLKPPTTGDFRFAGVHAEGARIWINNQLVYDNANASGLPGDFFTAGPKGPQDVPLTAGVRVPIKVELYHHTTNTPRMVLWTRSATNNGGRSFNLSPQIVLTDWLFSSDPSPLPKGWTLSVQGSNYSKAEMLDGSVVLTDGTGSKHTWSKASAGGYTPPANEDGVLAVDNSGKITVTQGDMASVFNSDGTLGAVSSVLDSKKPAALQYAYSGSPPRLTKVTDPVSERSHTLHYNTDGSDSCYGGATKPQGAIGSAPTQMLCRIKYWDGTETRLWYSIAGTLDRVENPGSDVNDYTYLNELSANIEIPKVGANSPQAQKLRDAIGPLMQMRTPLINDWLATASANPDGFNDRFQIEYDSFYDAWQVVGRDQPGARPTKITMPTGNARPSTNQMSHSYLYGGPGEYHASVHLPDIVNAKKVTFDNSGRALATTNAIGLTASMEWNAKDKPTAVVDTTGRRTTNVYDHADRLIDTYGPAPASCFQGQLPTMACASTIPHAHTGYDEGMAGLQAQFYANPFLSGTPAVWQTGVGTQDGSLAASWGANPPVANGNGWSGRFTGELLFPAAGVYKLGLTAVDGVRLWIDDVSIIDSWTDKNSTAIPGTYTNTTAGARHRVRIDYYNHSGKTGALNFTWTPPGTSVPVTVPGQNLAPRYGLQTSNVADNASDPNVDRAPSKKGVTGFADPANGIDPVLSLATSATYDPDGANLVRRNSYEQPGKGYLRKLAQALPGGDIADAAQRATYGYYGDSETRANPCDAQSAPASQAGMVKSITAAKNADGSANIAETVYDNAGRVVASRINTQPWSCTAFDARGRTTKQSYPAIDGRPARTVTYDYAVNGNPLVEKVSDESGSTTIVVDLIGQLVSYTDANGVVTTSQYDRAGRKVRDVSTIKGVSSTIDYHWDNATLLTSMDLDGVKVATPSYEAGILKGATYSNNSSLSIGRGDAGVLSTLTWKTGGSTVTDAVTRARDQRITDDTITDSSGGIYKSSYTYDGVGRLIAAAVPHHQLAYAYAGANGCGPDKKAGLNSNRTSFTDSFDGAAAITTNYCYDNADRLISTNGATTLALGYDAYGNTAKIGGDTLGYDSTRRHVSTSTADGTTINYARDVNDRIMMRSVQTKSNGAPISSANRYGYTGPTGSIEFVLDGNGNLLQRTLPLPGGVLLTKTYTGSKPSTFSYPNIHGDILFTADNTGTRTGNIHLYDPFGQNIDPATGVIGDIPIPDTASGGLDFGYLGQHRIPIEHLAGEQALEMGARTYLPILGRFLQTDPVSGGSANNYDYANADPINSKDLSGRSPMTGDTPSGLNTLAGAAALVVAAVGAGAGAAIAAGDALGNILLKVAQSLADNYDSGKTPPNKDEVLGQVGRQIGEDAKASSAAGEIGSVSEEISAKISELGLGQRDAALVALAAAKAAFPGVGIPHMLRDGSVAIYGSQLGAKTPALIISLDGSVRAGKVSVYPSAEVPSPVKADINLYDEPYHFDK